MDKGEIGESVKVVILTPSGLLIESKGNTNTTPIQLNQPVIKMLSDLRRQGVWTGFVEIPFSMPIDWAEILREVRNTHLDYTLLWDESLDIASSKVEVQDSMVAILSQVPHDPSRCVFIIDDNTIPLQQMVRAGCNVISYSRQTPQPRCEIAHSPSISMTYINSSEMIYSSVISISIINDLYMLGNEALLNHGYQQAGSAFRLSAEKCIDIGDRTRASALFARAAIAQEHQELWRNTSLLWYKTAQSLLNPEDVPENLKHIEYDLSEHHYPSITPEQWDEVPVEYQAAKALRYAGYHAQNTDSPQDSYVLYNFSALDYEDKSEMEKASEVMKDACLSFIQEYGDLSQEYIDQLVRMIRALPVESQSIDMGVLFLKQVAHAIAEKQNPQKSEQLLIEAYDRRRQQLWIQSRYVLSVWYAFWNVVSRYGTSLGRWTFWTIVLCFGLFPVALYFAESGSSTVYTFIDYQFASFYAFTTVGVDDLISSNLGRLVAAFEIATGYVFLGILISLLVRKVGL